MGKNQEVLERDDILPERMTTRVREIECDGFKWIDLMKPTSRELNLLMDEFDFPEIILEDCLSEHRRCKVDVFKDYTFAILLYPCYKKDLMRIEAEEVDFFIGKDYLITLHEGRLTPVVSLAALCQDKGEVREKYMSEGSAMLMYEINKILFECCFPLLDRMSETLDGINKQLFKDRSNQMLEEISHVKTEIISFRRVIQPMGDTMRILQDATRETIPKGSEIFVKDIEHNIETIWSMLENYKEVIETFDSTFATLTNQRMNRLMRTFTILQVLITPVIIVNMLFSINVGGIPMANSPNAFWILVGGISTIITLIATVLYLKRNTWL